ncbi:AAA family ATPase [Streptomyces sp. NPDC058682]|uniref:AAA family ATPase n=1 Tax=Streptomyces sp. NPDC058682 TaxID=3346596 RepID=UPI00365519F7
MRRTRRCRASGGLHDSVRDAGSVGRPAYAPSAICCRRPAVADHAADPGRAFAWTDRYGETIKLRVGRPDIPDVLPGAAHEVISAYRDLPLVSAQGDGFRSFVQVLLHAMVRPTPVVIIDEPGAFLHPPQARLLGQLLAGMEGQAQLFVATHSADFLAGVLEAQQRRPLSIVRLDRSSGTPRAQVLATDVLREYGGLRIAFQRLGGIVEGLRADVKVEGMVAKLNKLVKGSSGWDVLKRTGLSGLQGDEHVAAQRVLDAAADLGLYIAPCGELESWVRQVPNGKKSGWARKVFEEAWHSKPTPELRAFCESIRAYFRHEVADYDRAAAQALQVGSELRETEAVVTNSSHRVLTEVRVIRATAVHRGDPIRGSLWAEDADTVRADLAPGETFTVALGKMVWEEHEGFFPSAATGKALTVHFRDAAGLWWERKGDAQPTRLVKGPSEPDPRPE